MTTEKEMARIELAMIYELRLVFGEGEKTEYTREEILELLDKIALAKKLWHRRGPGNRFFFFFADFLKELLTFSNFCRYTK